MRKTIVFRTKLLSKPTPNAYQIFPLKSCIENRVNFRGHQNGYSPYELRLVSNFLWYFWYLCWDEPIDAPLPNPQAATGPKGWYCPPVNNGWPSTEIEAIWPAAL